MAGPVQKSKFTAAEVKSFLRQMIMEGDRGDGIPNFMSDPDTFVVDGKRQTPLRKAKVAKWCKIEDPDRNIPIWCESWRIGYLRNRELINLECIPEKLMKQIINTYENVPTGTYNSLQEYFMKHRLLSCLEKLYEF